MPQNISRQAVRWCAVALVLASCVGCDQFTKRVAQEHLKGRLPHSYCGDVFRLQYAENPGAFLGLGGELPAAARTALLIGFNSLITVGLVVAVALGWHFSVWQLGGCALLLAGAIGNLIDRLRFDGLVIDFMNLGVGPLRSGIFNVADVAIVVGALLLAFPLSRRAAADECPTAS